MGHAARIDRERPKDERRRQFDGRNVFIVGPDKKIKLIFVYPMTTGRNFDEVLRVIDPLQLTANYQVSTPVNWQPGDDVIIALGVRRRREEEVPGRLESTSAVHSIVPQPDAPKAS